MTRELAIEILKYNSNVIHKTIKGETDPNEVEALDMAIKALEQEPTNTIDYRRAFKIACDLLNGDILYGVDTDKIYELMMKKDEVVSSSSYEEYILNHLQDLDQGQYANEPTTKDDAPENNVGNIEPTTKNDLRVDCISRAQTQTEIEMNASRYTISKERGGMGQVEWSDQLIKVSDAVDIIRNLPSVTPKYSSGLEKKLEKDFGELDCISRQAVLDLVADYDLSMGQVVKGIHALPSVTPQPRKGHCTANLLEELEQEPVLDKIRAEIRDIKVIHDEYSQRQNDYCDGVEFAKRYVLQIIDKYKAESEG